MSYRIAVDNVSFHYVPEYPVLVGVSLEFQVGATAIIGENGAGKTTLMKLLNGLLKPVEGSILVGNGDTKNHDASQMAKKVGLVFQNPDDQIFKNKVIDEVMFGPLNIGAPAGLAQEAARAALREVELEHVAEENPYDLSYTERKRICVASILAMDTDVVIFDEPTISQDVHGLRLMGNLIRKLARKGKTVIAIVHDMDFVAEHFPRIVVMAKGRVIADGPAIEVFKHNELLHTAKVDAPGLVKLSRGVGLSGPVLDVDRFVEAFKNEKLGGSK